MKILVIGSGGREHALALALKADPQVTDLYCMPGNPGISQVATLIEGDANDGAQVAQAAQRLGVDLVVVGPEAPLVAGVADAVRQAGIACFGPGAEAARLEGSKAFAKQVMEEAGVPTARALTCHNQDELQGALAEFGAPYVVKEDGLAAGKGVVVTSDLQQALDHGADIFARGGSLIVEEYLDGPEVSLFCVCDGKTVLPLAPAQDFKRALDGDEGPNTGGMGAYSPLEGAPADLTEQVLQKVAVPTVQRMAERGTPFTGLLYCGLALTSKGVRVVEFNVRFGDPETQVVLARLRSPLGQLLLAAATGKLADFGELEWSEQAGVCVVLASPGYPQKAKTGGTLTGLEEAEALEGVHVVHAGTARKEQGLVSAGGRVLAVVALGQDIEAARTKAYQGMQRISLPDGHYRLDIAKAKA